MDNMRSEQSSKISDILNTVSTPNTTELEKGFQPVIQPENVLKTTIDTSAPKPETTTPKQLEQTEQVLQGLSDYSAKDKIDEQVKLTIVPLFEKMLQIAKDRPNSPFRDRYNAIVDNAVAVGWVDSSDSPIIASRIEEIKQNDTKAQEVVSKVEAKITELTAITDIFELNSLRKELTVVDMNGLSSEMRGKVNAAIAEIDKKIDELSAKIKEESEKVPAKKLTFWEQLTGQKAA